MGAVWNSCPMPWPQYEVTMEHLAGVVTPAMAVPTSRYIAPGCTNTTGGEGCGKSNQRVSQLTLSRRSARRQMR